jgi:Ca2+-dependent lipid-binding protein
MPSTVKIRVVEARNLPVMDRKSGSTDAYVEMRFGEWTDRTTVIKKSLNPIWEHTFKLEILDDNQLQDFPLELKIKDSNVYASDDTIGMVILDLNHLLQYSGRVQRSVNGWFPIFDSLRGICGYLVCSISCKFLAILRACSCLFRSLVM